MEYFDIVDERGEPTGKIIERSEAHKTGALHRTSHVWIMRMKNGRKQVLLQRRCMSKDSFPGCYDISSAGHIPAGKDYVESALRELKEELGLDAKPEELIDCGFHRMSYRSVFHDIPYHDEQLSKVFLLWKDVEISQLKLQKEEIDDAMWMDFQDLYLAVETTKYQGERFIHCIDINELNILRNQV